MMFSRQRHKVPVLNTTSTADISFMLLIFFLVTTSMDADKGLTRQLPPYKEQQQQEETNVSKDKLMTLRLDDKNALLLNEKPFPIGRLRGEAERFILRGGKEHLISVSMDPESRYDMYFRMQNELVAAYREVRDQAARKRFGRAYANCSPTEKDRIRTLYPQRIAEVYDQGGSAR